jgi:hypothetical protein
VSASINSPAAASATFTFPTWAPNGIREFNKWFYNQTRKEGMVVDVRGNGGGNVSRMLIERFRRQLLATGFSRTSERPHHLPRRPHPRPRSSAC